jgi:hypothetical protein
MMGTAAAAGPIQTLYDGNGSPVDQGWALGSITGAAAGTQIAHDGATEFITVNDTAFTSQSYLFKYDTASTNYIASLRLQVVSSSYNPLDAAITFNPFGNQVLASDSRANTFMIGNGIVLWGDEKGGSVSLNTSVFHDYELRYNAGQLSLYIDASFADIASGSATAALSRTVAASTAANQGYLIWGDATNDRDYNSDYIVDNVRFQNLQAAPVPELSILMMLGLGLGVLMLRRSRR